MTANVRLECFIDPSFGENAYVVSCRRAGPCWIIDPGLPPSAAAILEYVRREELTPDAVVLTHAHADHIAGLPEVLEAMPNLPVFIADEERKALTDPRENLSADLGASIRVSASDVRPLPVGGELSLDGTTWKVLDVCGHSPGGRALYCPDASIVIVGDALFDGSIGRTDFHNSDHGRLISNIKTNLLTLPDDTRVYSGHGPVTTIAAERQTNPFLS